MVSSFLYRLTVRCFIELRGYKEDLGGRRARKDAVEQYHFSHVTAVKVSPLLFYG